MASSTVLTDRPADPRAQESAVELSAEIKQAHEAKIAETKEQLSKVPWIQRVLGKKEDDAE